MRHPAWERAVRCVVEGAEPMKRSRQMAKVLGSFSITQEADGYLLHMEDDDGETVEYSATFEQLDLISEAIEEQLDMDEEDALGIDDDGEEAKDDEE
jgi:hypothetical protein